MQYLNPLTHRRKCHTNLKSAQFRAKKCKFGNPASNTSCIHIYSSYRVQRGSSPSQVQMRQSLPLQSKHLGVILDSNLSFENQFSHVTKTAFFHLRNISKLRNMLSVSDAEKLVHAFMTSRLDYCNALHLQ